MSHVAVIQLIKSLSKVEKRNFKLSAKKQSGKKDYLDLFDLIDQNLFIDTPLLKKLFEKLHPESSLDNTARYLLKILTDCLVQSKIKDDNLFKLMHGYLRVSILQERSLQDESIKELKKLQQLAISSQHHFMEYLMCRMELNYISGMNFKGISEQTVVELQMKNRELFKGLQNVNEHYSLYELLKYRLVHSGKTLSEGEKTKLNDLLLSELGLISGRLKNNIAAQKQHLLFQSFFLINIGDYSSALKTFSELNKLFENNLSIWNHPPLDYLSSLDGILDTLRTIGYFEDMPFYIDKMDQLTNPSYPEYFRFVAKKTIIIYKLVYLIGTKKYTTAIEFIENIDPLFLPQNMVDYEKQCEMLFAIGVAYYKVKNFKKAHKYINEIVLVGKLQYQSVIYKAARLLAIIMLYEAKNIDYLDYEINAYKRTFQNKGKLLKTEKIIFKVLKLRPNLHNVISNKLLLKKIAPDISSIEKDKFETQLLKYFNFLHWLQSKIIKSEEATFIQSND